MKTRLMNHSLGEFLLDVCIFSCRYSVWEVESKLELLPVTFTDLSSLCGSLVVSWKGQMTWCPGAGQIIQHPDHSGCTHTR